MTPERLSELVKAAASELGFDLCGIASAGPIRHPDFLRNWLAEKRAGRMGYLYRHLRSRIDVRAWLPWASSVIVTGVNYFQKEPKVSDDRPRGRVAMYAWGDDYHANLREKLGRLVARIQERLGQSFDSKVCVDTSAITERELAAMAGIGWIGKNTLVLNRELGSYFLLGEVITSLAIAPDPPETDHCGACTRCLDACPTGAFPAAYEMDPRRCISYLTIEHRGELEPELATKLGDWVFGCDICQQVCPFNQRVPETNESGFKPRGADAARPELESIRAWDQEGYEAFTVGRAVARARIGMWKRNADLARLNARPETPDHPNE
ncbi:MAG: tRNA epoxyqueuosine(34) reductase QueG [Planctomycetota bacterium]|nr:MAG: tRNA epoxyqueuosine(34) reductase QueG [Planctomycetota bacterium]